MRALSVMFGISVLVFLIFFATPGADPAARLAGRGATDEALAAVRAEYGLDRPLPVQYAVLMHRLFVTRDLPSFVNRGQMVVPQVLRAARATGQECREGLFGPEELLAADGVFTANAAAIRAVHQVGNQLFFGSVRLPIARL